MPDASTKNAICEFHLSLCPETSAKNVIFEFHLSLCPETSTKNVISEIHLSLCPETSTKNANYEFHLSFCPETSTKISHLRIPSQFMALKPQLKMSFKNSISGGRAGDAALPRRERRGKAPVDQGRLRARAGQGPHRFRQVWRGGGFSDVIVSCLTSQLPRSCAVISPVLQWRVALLCEVNIVRSER